MNDSATIIAYLSFAGTAVGVVYTVVNHKRLRSNCCGRKMELSIDVEQTTPPGAVQDLKDKADVEEGNGTAG